MTITNPHNVQIESTMLGFEDHGIFTAFINFKGDGIGISMGGMMFPKRLQYHVAFIQEVLKVLRLNSWEDLKGKYCRIQRGPNGVEAIGHLIEDAWFFPAHLIREARDERNSQ